VTEVGAHLLMLHEVMHEAASDERRTFPLRVRYRLEREQAMGAAEQTILSSVKTAKVVPVDGKKIAQAFEAWVTAKQPADKTRVTFLRHSKQFSEMMGDPWLSEVDKPMAIEFRDKLQEWAITKKKTATTADNILVSTRALFNVARDKGWLQSNPLERLTVDMGGKGSKKREPWTHPELALIFDDDIWTKHVLPADRKAGGKAAYWIPLIACYTGARVTEIAQLWTDDISTASGGEVFEFREDRDRGQKLKTEGSWRAVPMHSELVRLGLCKYVASLPKGPLFPSLPKDGQNGAGGQFSQWFGAFKQRKGFDSPSKAFHSFRHLVASELRLAGATDAQTDAITGHLGNGVGRRVYSATIRRQAERLRPTIELLNFSLPVVPWEENS
jgi:integrase